MSTAHVNASEVAILKRILRPSASTFSTEVARAILEMDFDEVDKLRMRELSAKARAGTLTAIEEAEAEKYERIGHLLNVMQSTARQSLQCHGPRTAKKSNSC
jgi:hypothetical protein